MPSFQLLAIMQAQPSFMLLSYCSLKGQPKSWFPAGGAELMLVKLQPITTSKPSTAYIKLRTGSKGGGLSNTGYWGIPVQDKQEYQLSVILQSETTDSANQVLPCLSCFGVHNAK